MRLGCRRRPAPARLQRLGVLLSVALLWGCAPPSDRAPSGSESLTWRFTDTALACDDDGNVYVAGAEQFPETAQILVSASGHYGETWSPHFEYVNRDSRGDRGRPQLVATRRGTVYVLWEDTRDGPLHAYLNSSQDGGKSWFLEDRRVNAQESNGRGLSSPRLVADERRVCVVWLDDREGFEAFYANISEDAGSSWLTQDIRVTDIDLGHKSAPCLIGDERGGIYLFWVELQGGRQVVMFSVSQDNGRTWSLQPQTLSSPGDDADRILPLDAAVLDSGTLVLSWTQYRGGLASTWVARSEDHGNTWMLPVQLDDELGDLFNPSAPLVRAEGFDTVHIAWQALTEHRIPILIVKTSSDDARSFQEQRFTRPRMPNNAWVDYRTVQRYVAPFSMATDGNDNAYLAWVDLDIGRTRLGFRRLSAQGIDTGFSAPHELDISVNRPATLEAPQICADISGHVYLLWNEARSLTFATSPFQGDTGWRFEHF